MATEITLRLKGLVLLPLLTRYLGAVNYGIWAQVALLVGLVTPLVAAGLDTAATRFFPGLTEDERRAQYSAVTAYMLLAAGIFTVVSWSLSEFLAEAVLADPEQARFVQLAGLLVITGFATQIARLHLRIIGRARLYGATNVVQSVLNTVAVVMVLLRGGDVSDVVLWTVGADAVLAVGLLLFIIATGSLGVPRFSSLGYLLRFGVVLIPAGYSMVVINWIDRIFLVNYRDLAAVGHYSVAYSLGYLVIAVVFNPIWVMFPTKAAELHSAGNDAGVTGLRGVSISLAMLFVLPVTVGWLILGNPIVELIAGEEFIPGAHVVWIITVGYSFHMVGSYFDIGLGLHQKQRWTSISMGLAVGTNLILNWLLIPEYGITGAAFATMIAFGVQAVISIAVHSRVAPISIDLQPLVKIGAAAGVMAIPLAVLSTGTLWELAGVISTGVVLYAVVIVVLKPLSLADVRSKIGSDGEKVA